ncbi:SAM-dependent methyltransferase [Aminobacter sp. UC22_36]|uniref:SAM-dependent methyltransferase n=1 Tax=Aminobacter sp. UC22_36 TaxID=3374549 RepID=UPI003756EBEC
MAIPERIVWAIDHLAVHPGDRLLEIGCGRGVAMAEITPLLIDGHITGLDRSDSAISSAGERNRAAVTAGKAALVQGAFVDWKGAGRPFDKIFAINVNLFWLEAARELKLIRSPARPRGPDVPVLRAAKCWSDSDYRARHYRAPGSGQIHAGKDDARNRSKAAAARHGRQAVELTGHKKLCGSMSTCTRTEPRTLGPAASSARM